MPPINDWAQNAILISVPTSFSYSTVGSTGGSGNPIDDDFPSYLDVWYRIEPSVDILIHVEMTQTGGSEPNGPYLDLARLIGSDPPTNYSDLEYIDWVGDATPNPTLWGDNDTQYVKLSGGEIYYLECSSNSGTSDVTADVVITTGVPIPNDDWEDATVINTPGGNSYAVNLVGAGVQIGESNDAGNSGPSVWYKIIAQDDGVISMSVLNSSGYRVEAEYRHRLRVRGPVTGTPTLSSIQAAPLVATINDNGPQTSLAPYRGTTGWEPWYVEWMANTGDVFYVRVSNSSQLGDPKEGTFDLRVTLPSYTEMNVDSGANLDSDTVLIVDTDWVRETQYRNHDHDEWKGDLDYTETFAISPGLSGNYHIELYCRCDSPTNTHENFTVIMRKNGKPIRVESWWEFFDNDVAKWVPLTQEYSIGDFAAGVLGTVFARDFNPAGNPRYVQLTPSDELEFHMGNVNDANPTPPNRYIEVQKIRFSPAGAYDPLPSGWKATPTEMEQGFQANTFMGVQGRSLGNQLFLFNDVDPRVFGDTTGSIGRREFLKLGVWRYELQDGVMVAIDGDKNLGASGGELMDIRLNTTSNTIVPFLRDLTVMPNGDIYCLWTEGHAYFVMKKWDGASWSLISDDVAGLGSPYSGWTINHVSIDNDGEDVFFTYGKNKTNGVVNYLAGNGYRWHCWKYDTSADTFTQLGTGQTAYPSATLGQRAGDFDHPPRIKVSPNGVPWVIWCEQNPDTSLEEYMHVYFWNGSAWVDAEIPHPAVPPPQVANSTYEAGSPGNEKGNYVNLLGLECFVYDLVFCHHDGPSETPAVIHDFNWDDTNTIIGGTHPGDTLGLFYAECDGVGDWHHEKFYIPGIDWGRDYGGSSPRLNHATDSYSGNLWLWALGGWDQGLWLDIYQNRPILFTQAGFFGAGVDGIVTLSLNSDGNGWQMLGPGLASDSINPDPYAYAWSDFSQPGCVVNGTPVAWWLSPWGFGSGYWMAAYGPLGAIDLTRIKFRGFALGDLET